MVQRCSSEIVTHNTQEYNNIFFSAASSRHNYNLAFCGHEHSHLSILICTMLNQQANEQFTFEAELNNICHNPQLNFSIFQKLQLLWSWEYKAYLCWKRWCLIVLRQCWRSIAGRVGIFYSRENIYYSVN